MDAFCVAGPPNVADPPVALEEAPVPNKLGAEFVAKRFVADVEPPLLLLLAPDKDV